jgi:hypothetical protein
MVGGFVMVLAVKTLDSALRVLGKLKRGSMHAAGRQRLSCSDKNMTAHPSPTVYFSFLCKISPSVKGSTILKARYTTYVVTPSSGESRRRGGSGILVEWRVRRSLDGPLGSRQVHS